MWRHSGHRGPAAWQAMSTEPLTCRPGFGSPACSLFGGRLQKACCIVVHLSAEGICLQWAELCQRAFALHAQIFPQWCKDSHHKCVPAAESEPWQAAGAGGRGAVSVPACLLLCAGAPVCGCSPGADADGSHPADGGPPDHLTHAAARKYLDATWPGVYKLQNHCQNILRAA